MAYNNNPITTRLDGLRSRNPPSTTAGSETSSGYTTPSRYSGSFMPSHSQSANDNRASLQRRFTTDLSKMPNLTPIGQQPAQVQESVDAPNTVSQHYVHGGCERAGPISELLFILPSLAPLLFWTADDFFHSDPPQGSTRKFLPRSVAFVRDRRLFCQHC